MLEWDRQPFDPYPVPQITLRSMTVDDLPRVVEVDAAAFEPLWQNSLPALSKAFYQAVYVSSQKMNQDGGVSAFNGESVWGDLARRAVRPEMQGRGIASALIGDLSITFAGLKLVADHGEYAIG